MTEDELIAARGMTPAGFDQLLAELTDARFVDALGFAVPDDPDPDRPDVDVPIRAIEAPLRRP